MTDYTWAINKFKLQRALQGADHAMDEETIKSRYIALGGKINEKASPQVKLEPTEAIVQPDALTSDATNTEEVLGDLLSGESDPVPPKADEPFTLPAENEAVEKPKRGRKKKDAN